MKHYLSLIIIICLLLSGCTNRSGIEDANPVNVPEYLKGVTFDEHMTISIGFWNIQDMVNSKSKDAILTYIENLFNITIEPVSTNWSDYKARYQILNATGSFPDVFANLTVSSSDNKDTAGLANMIDSGTIRSLPEDLSKYPNIRKLFDTLEYTRYSDGKYYFIPRLSLQEPILSSTDAAMVVRKDWMESLGLSAPKSLEEFVELVRAFASEDPDGNGIDDTAGYNVNDRIALGKWLILGIAPECNVFGWVETSNGYIPSYITEDFKKVVKAYRTLYEKGGLDPDFYMKKSSDGVNDFAHGRLGALEYKSSPSALLELKTQWEMYSEKPFADSVGVLPIFPFEDGKYYSNSSNSFWSESYFSADVDDSKLERILYLYDFLLSREGLELINYGIEGVDYRKTDNGYQCLIDLDNKSLNKVLQKQYPSLLLFGSLAIWGGTRTEDFKINEINNLRYGEDVMEIVNTDLQWNMANTISVERPYDFLLMPKENTDLFNKEKVIDDFTKIIIGSGDPVKMWEEIIDSYREAGLDEYIVRQNKRYKEYRNR